MSLFILVALMALWITAGAFLLFVNPSEGDEQERTL